MFTANKILANKKMFWVGGVVLLILILIGAIFAFITLNKKPARDTILLKENGSVQFKLSDSEEYKNMDTEEISINSGTSVKTGDGQAHILFSTNSILSINKNSEVKIDFAQDQKNININQLAGNTWSRVKALASNENFTVNTPTALASVRGTKFAVAVSSNGKKSAGVYTIESKVGVKPIGDESQELLVTPMRYVEVFDDSSKPNIRTGDILKEEFQGRWFKRNRVIDKWFDSKNNIDKDTFTEMLKLEGLPEADKTKDESTKKNDCLNILDQNRDEAKNPSDLEIVQPQNRSTWTLGSSIPFEAKTYNACTGLEMTQLDWQIVDSEITLTGKSGEIKGLPLGSYRLKATATTENEILHDFVFIRVVEGAGQLPDIEENQPVKKIVKQPVQVNPSTPISKPNQPPVVAITNPKSGTYTASIFYPTVTIAALPPECSYEIRATATAIDPEDGNLPANNITWFVDGTEQPTRGNYISIKLRMVSCNKPQSFQIKVVGADFKGATGEDIVTITLQGPV